MALSFVTLEAYSKKTEPDWHGDFTYYDNPLEKYKDHKIYAECHMHYARRGERETGAKKITVHTSKEFMHIMGWDGDLKYIKKD